MKINLELTVTESLMLLNALTQYILHPGNEKDKDLAESVRNKIRKAARKEFFENVKSPK